MLLVLRKKCKWQWKGILIFLQKRKPANNLMVSCMIEFEITSIIIVFVFFQVWTNLLPFSLDKFRYIAIYTGCILNPIRVLRNDIYIVRSMLVLSFTEGEMPTRSSQQFINDSAIHQFHSNRSLKIGKLQVFAVKVSSTLRLNKKIQQSFQINQRCWVLNCVYWSHIFRFTLFSYLSACILLRNTIYELIEDFRKILKNPKGYPFEIFGPKHQLAK